MGKLDNIRSSQTERQVKKELKRVKAKKSKNRRSTAFRAFVIALKVFVLLFFVAVCTGAYWLYNQIDFSFGDDLGAFSLKLSSTIYCKDDKGNYVKYEEFKSSEKRVWVDIDEVPQDMRDAFVAIEDQRFYEHSGVDIKRTFGAVVNVFVKGDSSYGGSTITQQLVKNITNDNERTGERKIREITRAMVLEEKMTKDQILEMYMNSIYLSQGVHGVQAAADVYFGKKVKDLSLAECACIAGITQFPTTYDPIINPENNKEKQLLVLSKMYELGYITEDEYDKAVVEKLVFVDQDEREEYEEEDTSQSYYADYIFEQAKQDLMKEFEYTEQFAEDFLCNGGLKIYANVDLKVQETLENYYEDDSNFPKFSGPDVPQSAMVVMDPSTGEIKGMVGGRGEKQGMRVLNRASQSKRQPGSSIKPIAVYAPALEENVINLSTTIANAQINIGGWKPKNSNGKFTGPVSVKTAVAWSYNIPAINTLEALTVETSFDYLKNKMHMDSLVESTTRNGRDYSDKNLSALALGGMTDGVTPLEMTAAYCTLANGGMYIEPMSYSKICDKDDKLFYEKKPVKNRVFSEETAFLAQQLLYGVVTNGTASGNKIGKNATCGKTGTTDDNKDKWFIGFTPHYCGAVWFGYDNPRAISTGSNPSIAIWKNIMTALHQDLKAENFDVPSGIVKARVCPYTGMYESGGGATVYANKKFLDGYCGGKNHGKYIGWKRGGTVTDSGTKTDKKTNEESEKPKSDTKSESDQNEGGSSSNEGGSQTSGNDSPPSEAPSGGGSAESGTGSSQSGNEAAPPAPAPVAPAAPAAPAVPAAPVVPTDTPAA